MLKIVSSICDTILCLKAELTRSVESHLVLIKVMSSIYLYVPFGHFQEKKCFMWTLPNQRAVFWRHSR